MKILLIVTVTGLFFLFIRHILFMKTLKRIPLMQNDDIILLFQNNRFKMLRLKAAQELSKRNADIKFSFDYFLEMAMSDTARVSLIGWEGLKQFFPNKLIGLDLSETIPSRSLKDRLKSLQ